MTMISENFSLREMTYSEKAELNGVDNIPTEENIQLAKLLANTLLEPARKKLGEPISVNSWFRNEKVNKLAKGSATSDHRFGGAIDIQTKGDIRNKELFDILREIGGFDQLIYEFGDDTNPNWIHVSIRQSGNRGQVLRARKNSKGETYFEQI